MIARFLSIPLFAFCLAFPTMLVAQPSFRCSGQLNATERAICDSAGLSALDRQMASAFRNRFRALNEPRQQRLRQEQLLWLRWRNSCGRDARCLERRYNERITDFDPDSIAIVPAQPVPAGPNDVVERRLRDGRFETVYGDGRINWSAVDGTGSGTIFPDGTQTIASPIQIPGAPIPPLPANMSDWGELVESDLLSIVDVLLAPQDRSGYRDLFAHEAYPERMLSHLQVIRHLVGN